MGTLQSTTLQNRLTAYSALATAGACAVAAAPKAEAAVVYSGPLNVSVTVSTLGSYFNLTTFAVGASFASVNGGDATAPVLNLWGTGSTFSYLYPSTSTVNRFESIGAAPADLAAGTDISAASTYGTSRAPGALSTTGGWAANTTGYLGIKFLNGTTTEYGWVQIFYPGTPTTANPIKILGAAYDNTGLGLAAGQTAAVPEPGTVAALAFGALGVGALAWRRRKVAA